MPSSLWKSPSEPSASPGNSPTLKAPSTALGAFAYGQKPRHVEYMIFLIFFGGIIAFGLLGLAASNQPSESGIQGFLYVLMALVLVGVIAACMYPSPLSSRYTEDDPSNTVPIASFANAQEIEGTSGGFLSSGTIGEKTVYRYVHDHKDGTYTLDQLDLPDDRVVKGKDDKPVSGVVVMEDADPEDARIEFYDCVRGDPIAEFLKESCGELTVFHIPEGSISREFSLDPAAG